MPDVLSVDQLKQLNESLSNQVKDGLKSQEEATAVLQGEIEKINQNIDSLKSAAGISLSGLDEEMKKKQFSFAKMAYGIAMKSWDHAGFEKEIIDQTKAQTVSPDTAGGFLVPIEVSNTLIEQLIPEVVLMASGARRLDIPNGIGKLDLPKKVGTTTANWLGELANIPDSDVTFGNVRLDPKKVAARVIMSKEVLRDANQSVENIVRQDMVEQLALALDLKGLFGDGTNDTPIGILNTPDIQVFDQTDPVYANGVPANWNLFDELQALLEDENALRGKLGYVSNPRVFRALGRNTVDMYSGQAKGEGMPLFTPFISRARLAEEVGYPFMGTTQVDKTGTKGTGTDLSTLFFGNFEDLLLGSWGALEIDASEHTQFATYGMEMRAVMRADWAVRNPKSFAVATNVETTV